MENITRKLLLFKGRTASRHVRHFLILYLQQDSAPAHCAKETVDLLSTETPAFILPPLAT